MSSPLRRLGNKARLLPQLLELFPEHITTFIDMFLGSGTVTFAMVGRAKCIIANDNDDNIFNLFMVIKERKEELLDVLTMMPVHESLFKYWKTTQEQDPIWKAVRFLMLSNFGYLGQQEYIRFTIGENVTWNHKKCIERGIQYVFSKCDDKLWFMCEDFRNILSKKISFKKNEFGKIVDPLKNTFIYADPPFLNTTNNYQNGFTEQDSADLFTILVASDIRFAMSEFRHPFILEQADKYGLYVTSLGERRNLKNRREEILITNYDPTRKQQELF